MDTGSKGPYRDPQQYMSRGNGKWTQNSREIKRGLKSYMGGMGNPRNTDAALIEMQRPMVRSNLYGDGRQVVDSQIPFAETRPVPESARLLMAPPENTNRMGDAPMGAMGTLPPNAGPSPISGPMNPVVAAPGLFGEQIERKQMGRHGMAVQLPMAGTLHPAEVEDLAHHGLPFGFMPKPRGRAQ